jgi:hypothetical protein
MKGALGCLAIGSIAGIFAFAGEKSPAPAEILFVLGFASGLALLLRNALTSAGSDLPQGRLPGRRA